MKTKWLWMLTMLVSTARLGLAQGGSLDSVVVLAYHTYGARMVVMRAGSRLRIDRAPEYAGAPRLRSIIGVVDRLAVDTLYVAGRSVPLASASAVHFSVGHGNRMGAGAAVGGALGAVFILLTAGDANPEDVPMAIALFGTLSAGLGAGIGSMIPGDAWARLDLGALRSALRGGS